MKTATKALVLCATFLSWLLPAPAAQAQSWQTAVALPTSAGDASLVSAVQADGAGGYVVAGSFTGTITLGSFVLTSAGAQDVFVARLSSLGVYTQAVRVGGTGDELKPVLALDASGTAVVAAGFTSPTLVVGATTLTNLSTSSSNSDVFVGRLNLAGQWTQAVRAGGPDDDKVNSLALDATGTAVMVGDFNGGAAKFGSLTATSQATSGAFYVARLASTGAWTQVVTAVSNGVPHTASSLALDAAGNATICGVCLNNGTLTFGTRTLNTAAGSALFVARLNKAGTWTQLSQTPASFAVFVLPSVVALDAAGNAVVGGSFRGGNANFGAHSLTYIPMGNQGYDNLFVARLSAAGEWTQAVQAQYSSYSSVSTLALTATGDALVTGVFLSPTIGFGTTSLNNSDPQASSTPSPDIFVARLTSGGSWAYARQAGGQGYDYPVALLAENNSAVLGGYFGPAPASFGALTLTTPAASAGFLARLGGVLPTLVAVTGASPTLAPNPARHAATLTLPAAAEVRPTQLLNAQGRTVRQYMLPAHATTLPLDLADLPSGVYLLRCGPLASRLLVE